MRKWVTVRFSPVLLVLEGKNMLSLHSAVLLLPILLLCLNFFPKLSVILCGKKHCFNISCASFSAITPGVMVSLVRPTKVTLLKQFMTVQGYRLCTCRTPLQQWLVYNFSVTVSSLHAVHSLPHRGLYCQVLTA